MVAIISVIHSTVNIHDIGGFKISPQMDFFMPKSLQSKMLQ